MTIPLSVGLKHLTRVIVAGLTLAMAAPAAAAPSAAAT
jgi:hypothetical protein